MASTPNPTFSIILPVYNRADFIRQTLESILAQRNTDFEVICIDDASTDNSASVIEEMIKTDARIRLLRLPKNQGRCMARNEGIRSARAPWICFLDSDDRYYPNHLETLAELIIKHPEQTAFATSQHIGVNSVNRQLDHERRITFAQTIRSNPLHNLNQLCFNRHDTNVLFPDENIPVSEDWLFIRQLTYKTDILQTSVVTAILNEHDNRTMRRESSASIAFWNVYASEYFLKHHEIDSSLKKQILSHTLLLASNILLSKGQKNEAQPYLSRALSFMTSYGNPLLYKAVIKLLTWYVRN